MVPKSLRPCHATIIRQTEGSLEPVAKQTLQEYLSLPVDFLPGLAQRLLLLLVERLDRVLNLVLVVQHGRQLLLERLLLLLDAA